MSKRTLNNFLAVVCMTFLALGSACGEGCSKDDNGTESGVTGGGSGGGSAGSETSGRLSVNQLPAQSQMVMDIDLERLVSPDLWKTIEESLVPMMLASGTELEVQGKKIALEMFKDMGGSMTGFKSLLFAQGGFTGDAVAILTTDFDIVTILKKFLTLAKEGDGVNKTPVDIDGVQVWAPGNKNVIGLYNKSTLLVADNIDDLTVLIASLRGKGPSLKENSAIQGLLAKVPSDADLVMAGTPVDEGSAGIERMLFAVTATEKETSVLMHIVPKGEKAAEMKQGLAMFEAMKPMLKMQADRQLAQMAPLMGQETAGTAKTLVYDVINSTKMAIDSDDNLTLTARTSVTVDKVAKLMFDTVLKIKTFGASPDRESDNRPISVKGSHAKGSSKLSPVTRPPTTLTPQVEPSNPE